MCYGVCIGCLVAPAGGGGLCCLCLCFLPPQSDDDDDEIDDRPESRCQWTHWGFAAYENETSDGGAHVIEIFGPYLRKMKNRQREELCEKYHETYASMVSSIQCRQNGTEEKNTRQSTSGETWCDHQLGNELLCGDNTCGVYRRCMSACDLASRANTSSPQTAHCTGRYAQRAGCEPGAWRPQ